MLRGLWASALIPRDLPPGVTLDQAIEWTRTHLEGQRLLLASIVVMFYEWVITIDEEQEFIWQKGAWSVTKVLFMVNRYFPILHSVARFWSYTHELDPRFSAIVSIYFIIPYNAKGITGMWAGSEFRGIRGRIILMLRLWAMYARSKIFGAFLVFVFIAGFGTALAIRQVQPPDDFKLVREPPLALTVCKRSSPSELFFLYAIVLLVETTIFGLLLWKVWQLSSIGVAPILKTMLKHGTQYYLIVFVALFFQVLGTVLQALWQPMADSLLVVAIASVACSRLVLSLRGIYTTPKQATTIQEFQARTGVTGDQAHASRPIRLSVLRSPTSSKPFVDSYFSAAQDEERSFDIPRDRDRSAEVSPIHVDDYFTAKEHEHENEGDNDNYYLAQSTSPGPSSSNTGHHSRHRLQKSRHSDATQHAF